MATGGGVFSMRFLNNLALNSAYTFGIIGSIAVEELHIGTNRCAQNFVIEPYLFYYREHHGYLQIYPDLLRARKH